MSAIGISYKFVSRSFYWIRVIIILYFMQFILVSFWGTVNIGFIFTDVVTKCILTLHTFHFLSPDIYLAIRKFSFANLVNLFQRPVAKLYRIGANCRFI